MFEVIHFHWGSGFFWPDCGFKYPLFWGIAALSFVIRSGGPY